ncbi:MAG: PIG-L deacetylase family protein [Terriglobales bacterium]
MFRLLCVTAHPDDEAGGFGGSLATYRDRGVETYIICLTPGQAASHRGGHASAEELAAVRRQEFAASCKILNVTRGEVLNYPDAALDRTELYQVVGELTARIRAIRPHVIMTFGSEGAVTAHPDHCMACIFTTLAFQWAGRTNRYTDQLSNGFRPYRAQKLYYSTTIFTLPDRQPVSLAPGNAVIHIGDHLETKIRAFKAHETQSPLFEIFEKNARKRGQFEMFHLAASVNIGPIQPETDLFAGVVED